MYKNENRTFKQGECMSDSSAQVKGEALLSLPIFIIKKFGMDKYKRWLNMLTPEAQKIYSNPIAKGDWFPVDMLLERPTQCICDLFYNSSLRGAWECGRYSAEYGLKGIYKVLVKLRSPLILIKKAESILPAYYRPCKLEVVETSPESVTVIVTEFPDIGPVIENRIGGWMERAIEISGCRHVTVVIGHSVINYKKCTEYSISWKKGL